MLAIMQWMIAHPTSIGYNQLRPMANIGLFQQEFETKVAGGWKTTMDCSEFVTIVCKWAGLHDPNGLHYDGYGNSETMYDYRPHYTNPSWAHVGAIVAFGPNGADHAALVMIPSKDPTLCSHGSGKGPIAVKLSDLVKSMGSPVVTLLDVGGL